MAFSMVYSLGEVRGRLVFDRQFYGVAESQVKIALSMLTFPHSFAYRTIISLSPFMKECHIIINYSRRDDTMKMDKLMKQAQKCKHK